MYESVICMNFYDNRVFDVGDFHGILERDLGEKKNLLGNTHVCGRMKMNHFTIYSRQRPMSLKNRSFEPKCMNYYMD